MLPEVEGGRSQTLAGLKPQVWVLGGLCLAQCLGEGFHGRLVALELGVGEGKVAQTLGL